MWELRLSGTHHYSSYSGAYKYGQEERDESEKKGKNDWTSKQNNELYHRRVRAYQRWN